MQRVLDGSGGEDGAPLVNQERLRAGRANVNADVRAHCLLRTQRMQGRMIAENWGQSPIFHARTVCKDGDAPEKWVTVPNFPA
jgi:hypothetical protein